MLGVAPRLVRVLLGNRIVSLKVVLVQTAWISGPRTDWNEALACQPPGSGYDPSSLTCSPPRANPPAGSTRRSQNRNCVGSSTTKQSLMWASPHVRPPPTVPPLLIRQFTLKSPPS